jgi:hypothetical protein
MTSKASVFEKLDSDGWTTIGIEIEQWRASCAQRKTPFKTFNMGHRLPANSIVIKKGTRSVVCSAYRANQILRRRERKAHEATTVAAARDYQRAADRMRRALIDAGKLDTKPRERQDRRTVQCVITRWLEPGEPI